MPNAPELTSLRNKVVTITDPHGESARFTLDHAGSSIAICTYVFRGKREFPLRITPDDTVQLGAAHPNGWLTSEGKVVEATLAGSVTVDFAPLEITQRRRSYREEVLLPLVLTIPDEPQPLKGRTINVSTGGYAAKIKGRVLNGSRGVVTFDMPDGSTLETRCEKIGGDVEQRFKFLTLNMRDEDRIMHLVREAELERRRMAKHHAT